MCNVVKTDELLAVLLKNIKQISFRDLRRFRDIVEVNNPSIILDISAPSIDWAMNYYPNIFMRNKTHIMRAAKSSCYFSSKYLDNEFFADMHSSILNQLNEAINSL